MLHIGDMDGLRWAKSPGGTGFTSSNWELIVDGKTKQVEKDEKEEKGTPKNTN